MPTDDEYGEDKPDEKEETQEDEQKVSIATYFKFIIVMINSTLTSMTKYLNRFSRDYRYIRKVLTKEKKVLKVRDGTSKKFATEIGSIMLEIFFSWHRLIYRQNQISGWECD